mmetsp:Transcript_2328/g.6550  ORF Transcript_2328/g.6550 Transcript_2328/m.6550 type:complete len:246 (+) Transcript_2328:120-857(+)
MASTATTTTSPDGVIDQVQDVLYIGLSLFGFFMICAFRKTWGPPIYKKTCGILKCGSLRNFECIGRLVSCFCPCVFNAFHPPFRLRVTVHEGSRLPSTDLVDRMECYAIVTSGNNPVKTTSTQTASYSYTLLGNYVVWNDHVDIEVQVADEVIKFNIYDHDTFGSDDLIGEGEIKVSDFYFRLRGDDVRTLNEPMEVHLWLHQKTAGVLTVSLYATEPGKSLPSWTNRMMDPQHQSRSLLMGGGF